MEKEGRKEGRGRRRRIRGSDDKRREEEEEENGAKWRNRRGSPSSDLEFRSRGRMVVVQFAWENQGGLAAASDFHEEARELDRQTDGQRCSP